MTMVNLKSDPKESAKSTMLAPAYDVDEPAYPYGLQIQLCDEVLEKLGMTDLPKVGSEMTLAIKVTVTSVSQYEEAAKDAEDGGSNLERSVSLQITDIDTGAGPAKSMAERMYTS